MDMPYLRYNAVLLKRAKLNQILIVIATKEL